MSLPATLVTGSIAYLVLGVVLLGLVQAFRGVGKLSKDDAGTGNVVVIISVFSMWLFWLCAWMHQWHPLISPIYEA
eukprot:CAMPEP_0172394060 /NCGR_PEP_ID=MMETSP1061-20121228/13320_1 /TAXON_ID=37318 /ORGANISM="Pseudo-nitzschia pungens, Strain cf. pungens" /LENGTH=75 /DNA_ID=CAMNT_0013125329 /DNA_START=45 /DNA_END=272 /DNA_ORIENTATION=-